MWWGYYFYLYCFTNSNKSELSYTVDLPYDFDASTVFVSASPFKDKPRSVHYIAANGMNEKNWATFYPNLASGLFLISPGLKIDSICSFFNFKSLYISPLVLI